MRKVIESQQGFTLIEALTAMAILTIGVISLYTMQFTGAKVNTIANVKSSASINGANQVENFFATRFNDDMLEDVDGDGTGQDSENNGTLPEGNGVDDNGGNFGLGDYQCCQDGNDPLGNAVAGCVNKADGCMVVDGTYQVYWNVAVDEPMINTKKVAVYVVRSGPGGLKGVDYEYIVGRDMQGMKPAAE
ncbi:prepilin-type N-terminal cleavage/methylation domain-containing protein [Desulfopila sp. IMCC35008]|uniref:type IV pilus modification PilV family protein n=1 Tax=Desulfopila sp. IMCC35008 TaxID=2653858 RepID=UPI0013D45BF6|nr:prepilin-type N-terminal cleavage/methylation domain-containing protein [Desulfopila sp. IMCC35008]